MHRTTTIMMTDDREDAEGTGMPGKNTYTVDLTKEEIGSAIQELNERIYAKKQFIADGKVTDTSDKHLTLLSGKCNRCQDPVSVDLLP